MRYDMAPYHITCRRHISRRRHIASNGHIADPSGSISLSRLRRDKLQFITSKSVKNHFSASVQKPQYARILYGKFIKYG